MSCPRGWAKSVSFDSTEKELLCSCAVLLDTAHKIAKLEEALSKKVIHSYSWTLVSRETKAALGWTSNSREEHMQGWTKYQNDPKWARELLTEELRQLRAIYVSTTRLVRGSDQ